MKFAFYLVVCRTGKRKPLRKPLGATPDTAIFQLHKNVMWRTPINQTNSQQIIHRANGRMIPSREELEQRGG